MTGERYTVGIVGCGSVGAKRSKSLGSAKLVACADVDAGRARALATPCGAAVMTDWRQLIARDDVEIVVVSTPNDLLAPVTIAAVESGKHVLVEKPGTRTLSEMERVIDVVAQHDRRVRVGFNHRYHPALVHSKRLVQEGKLGDLMFVRGRYGHGGRVGYEKEWRADPQRSGGGELIDQGVHLIDLSRWFLGEFSECDGFAATFYWPMPVDDNAFLTLRTASGSTAFLHVSCTEWKNLFSLEIYGRNAKIHVEGLGGSYGTECLTFYQMLPEMGPPETTTWEYTGMDESWASEFSEFLEDIQLGRPPQPGLSDARAALEIVSKIYRQSTHNAKSNLHETAS